MHRPPRIRNLAKIATFATAATALVVGIPSAAQIDAADGLGAGTLSQFVGFEEGDRFEDMEAALGRPLDRVVTMTANQTPRAMRSSVYGQFVKSSAYLPDLSDRLDVTVTIPLAFGEKAPYRTSGPAGVLKGLKKTSSGAYDADYRVVARNLIAAGYSDAVLRLGHEFDGTWVQWSARDNEQGYIEAFRHVRDVFARESSEFRFEWTGMRAPWRLHAKAAYPGDAYVDIIGLDIYYRSPGTISDRVWGQYTRTLTDHRDFAISRGKPVSYPEWGRAYGDTDRFVSLMYDWFADLPSSGPGSLEYQSFFNTPHNNGQYDLDKNPNVRRRYLQLFSSTATESSPKTPPRVTEPAPLDVPAPPPTTVAPPPTNAPSEQPPATSSGSLPGIALVSGNAAIEVEWSNPADGRRNLRYRAVGAKGWTWVRWKQPIEGLNTGTTYEVQGRLMVGGDWQPWMTASVTVD